MLEGKKVFLFDMDGLLIDSEKMHCDEWAAIFEKYGVKNGMDVIYQLIGVTGEMSRKILKENTGDADFFKSYREEKEKAMYDFLNTNGMPVKPGARELLEYLKERNYPRVLVTSTRRQRVEEFLRYADLEGYFEHMVCGDDVQLTKPSPESYLKAVSDHHLNKEECIVLEDSKNGILAANQAEIDVIGIADLVDISSCNCYLYNSLNEVVEELKGLEKNILVTGFVPFGNDLINPSQEAVQLLPGKYLGYNIHTKVLPVDTTCFDQIKDELDQYDCILSLGLAASRNTYTIEQIGINIDDFRIPTNANESRKHVLIHTDGKDGYFAHLPIDSIITHLECKNIEMKISYSAGTYICNHLLYELGYYLSSTDIQYGFIHVPNTTDFEDIKNMILGVIEVL